MQKYVLAGTLAILSLFVLSSCSNEQASTASEDMAPAATSAPESPPQQLDIPTGRLPEGVSPLHYDLQLVVDPRQEYFQGEARIRITLEKAASILWMHGRALEIASAEAVLADGQSIKLGWEQLTEAGVARLIAENPLPAGEMTLAFSYQAPFNTALEGLHRVKKGGLDYAYTQFEATSARLAFPSFDEPGFKVPFDIRLTIPEEQVGITATPVLTETRNDDGSKTLTFATTKPLPTYLLAFAVGPFDVVQWEDIPGTSVREDGIPLRGITTRGRGEEIHYALKYTAEILMAMEEYFNTPYPYAKLDIIAIPDFSSGAMENAGAITYREQYILLNENASVNEKYNYFYTHAHELSHQWFGNLVTPVWWDDLWLKESFATWHGHIILDQLYPEDHYRDALFNGSAWAMHEDSLSSARRIREPILVHEDIAAAYDGITYAKGGGVLAMFEEFLGPENLRKGIGHYMKKYAWKNTTAEDFIEAITEANPQVEGEVLQQAFRSFIEQAGVPELSLSLDCTGEAPQLQVSQRRYLPLGSQGSDEQTWSIPACVTLYTDDGEKDQCFIAKGQSQTVALNTERCPNALLPNSNGSSYYRFAMPGEQWQELLARFDQLNTHEQISAAGSVVAAVNGGTMSMEDYLAAAPVIAASDSWRVSTKPRDNIYTLIDFGATEEQQAVLRSLLVKWYRPQLDQLNTLPSLTPDQERYRMLMLSTLALKARDQALLDELTDMAKAYTGYGASEQINPSAIDANYIYIALMAGVEQLGKPFADLLWRQFLAEENVTTRERILRSLATTNDQEVSAMLHEAILSPEVAVNEFGYIIGGQMSSPETQQAMWEWMQANFDAVIDRTPTWHKGQTPEYFNRFCSEEDASSVEAVFSPVIAEYEAGPRYLAKSLEKIRLCAAYIDRYGEPGA